MRRPFIMWSGVVVVLGVLLGCAQEPSKETAGTNQKQRQDQPPPPQPGIAGAAGGDGTPQPGIPGGPPVNPNPGGGLVIEGGEQPPGIGRPPQPQPPTTPSPPRTIGEGDIKVVECGFDGVEKAIDAAKGKVVLIDCWATWCGPCVASFPKLVEKHNKYADKGLAVISLSLDQPAASNEVIEFLKRHNATFTNLHLVRDPSAQKGLTDRFGYRNAIPHAVMFNKTGSRVWTGHPMDPKLESTLVAELDK